ncbi:universal stress protein [Streptomyces sp. H39-S7]|uniref:universal stress protein n=1 Tax=Streptomyces sp. H39-S7 TaxID=3004357 RepID=UPI0022AFB8F7|nr:universal stress protein [Streptomyces sp. H39-S7]MCZ4122751.1 universal stress protein [Streptomyces sp. H39-S7]
MSRNVVAGLDGSPESLAAAEWAAREAGLRGVTLRLVHAWDWQPYAYAPVGGEPRRHWAERLPRTAREELLGRHPELTIEADQVDKSPVEALLAAAGEAELLALGSRGLSGIGGFLVGSVALAVLARATRPVVFVRMGEREEDEHLLDASRRPSTQSPYRDVLLGLDLARPSDAVIEFAFDAAQRRATGLRVIHGWSLPPYYGYGAAIDPRLSAELAERETGALTEALLPWREKFPAVDVTAHAAVGPVAGHLVDAAADASLVVVGRRDRRVPFGAHIGPITHAVLHHAAAPVAVVPHD